MQAQATYSGVLCVEAMQNLARSVLGYAGGSTLLTRWDGAMLLGRQEDVRQFGFMRGGAVGAWIVRPDQFDAAVELSQRLAGIDVIRSVWLTSHAGRAQVWLARHQLA